MEQSKIYPSLIHAQSELENASTTSINPHYRSKYADLAEIINTIKPIYAKHNLGIIQYPSTNKTDGKWVLTVTTRIIHESGEFIESQISIELQDDNVQKMGSAITYLRRYSLSAMAGISQEDDDANLVAEQKKQKSTPEKKPEKESPKKTSTFDTAINLINRADTIEKCTAALNWIKERKDKLGRDYDGIIEDIKKHSIENFGVNVVTGEIIEKNESGELKL